MVAVVTYAIVHTKYRLQYVYLQPTRTARSAVNNARFQSDVCVGVQTAPDNVMPNSGLRLCVVYVVVCVCSVCSLSVVNLLQLFHFFSSSSTPLHRLRNPSSARIPPFPLPSTPFMTTGRVPFMAT